MEEAKGGGMLVQAKAKGLYKANMGSLFQSFQLIGIFSPLPHLCILPGRDGGAGRHSPSLDASAVSSIHLVSAAASLFCTWQLSVRMVLCSV